jgi:hypothetical protein
MRSAFFVTCLMVCFSFSANAEVMTYTEVKNMAKSILSENDYGLPNAKMADITSFCPTYNSLSADEKEEFFAHLVASISTYESGYNTQTTFVENNGNISAGLLQISYPSLSSIYKKNGCNANSTEDLKDAKISLQCGFAIISTLVKSGGFLANGQTSGASRYWSTLRTPYTVHLKKLNKTVTVGKKTIIIGDLKKKYARCF